ncbi:MAG: CPBP family glutamic-type intramembrane protease [Bacillota bacterium]|nr:CPBP family glutamic-type intramembrane protease [Bacillota bacterium]
MLTTNLTRPVSKKLLLALFIVTVGADLALYICRYSYFFNTIYEAIMVSSLFIGMKLFPRLGNGKIGPRRFILKFTQMYLIFYIGSLLINSFTTVVFTDFSKDYDQFVDTSASYATSLDSGSSVSADTGGAIPPVFQWFDLVGSDLYSDTLAGLEEVYRLSYMILILLFFKKIFSRKWNSGSRDIFLMLALFISSLFFGIGHSLDTEKSWIIAIGSIVNFTNLGLLLGLLLLWTRNLWLIIIVHSVYDVITTLSWYYWEYTSLIFALVALIVCIVLAIIEKRSKLVMVDTVKSVEPTVQ